MQSEKTGPYQMATTADLTVLGYIEERKGGRHRRNHPSAMGRPPYPGAGDAISRGPHLASPRTRTMATMARILMMIMMTTTYRSTRMTPGRSTERAGVALAVIGAADQKMASTHPPLTTIMMIAFVGTIQGASRARVQTLATLRALIAAAEAIVIRIAIVIEVATADVDPDVPIPGTVADTMIHTMTTAFLTSPSTRRMSLAAAAAAAGAAAEAQGVTEVVATAEGRRAVDLTQTASFLRLTTAAADQFDL